MHTAQLTWQTLEWQLLTNKINIGILSDNEIAYYKKNKIWWKIWITYHYYIITKVIKHIKTS